MVRWCWVNFQCQGVLLIWIIVGQGPIALAVGAGGNGLDIFSLLYHFSLLSPIIWETARYRLKYCLKGPLNPNQPTNQSSTGAFNMDICRQGSAALAVGAGGVVRTLSFFFSCTLTGRRPDRH